MISTIESLSEQEAQRAVHTLLIGEPPTPEIVEMISVGLERDLRVFQREYFGAHSFLVSDQTKGSTFKLVEAYYGGGKTHYLRSVEQLAHKHGFASAFVSLKKDECPLTRFDLIYQTVADALTIPPCGGLEKARGLGNVIRSWVDAHCNETDSRASSAENQCSNITDLPLMSMKIALRLASSAYASGDHHSFDELLVYLTGGKMTSELRKYGILQPIDAKTGSLALRSLVSWIRQIGFSGFVLIMDEGDRSLSIGSVKDKIAASNNLVQLINETSTEGAWPSALLLYSIPSYQSFENVFGNNDALIQRTKPTGFPLVPPAPRIVLDERFEDSESKNEFCMKLSQSLLKIFRRAYPDTLVTVENGTSTAKIVAETVIEHDISSSFRRLFVQSFYSSLYRIDAGEKITPKKVEKIVTNQSEAINQNGV